MSAALGTESAGDAAGGKRLLGEILLELGRRRIVGGQEDMILDVALELARQEARA